MDQKPLTRNDLIDTLSREEGIAYEDARRIILLVQEQLIESILSGRGFRWVNLFGGHVARRKTTSGPSSKKTVEYSRIYYKTSGTLKKQLNAPEERPILPDE